MKLIDTNHLIYLDIVDNVVDEDRDLVLPLLVFKLDNRESVKLGRFRVRHMIPLLPKPANYEDMFSIWFCILVCTSVDPCPYHYSTTTTTKLCGNCQKFYVCLFVQQLYCPLLVRVYWGNASAKRLIIPFSGKNELSIVSFNTIIVKSYFTPHFHFNLHMILAVSYLRLCVWGGCTIIFSQLLCFIHTESVYMYTSSSTEWNRKHKWLYILNRGISSISIANTLEIMRSCTKPSIMIWNVLVLWPISK